MVWWWLRLLQLAASLISLSACSIRPTVISLRGHSLLLLLLLLLGLRRQSASDRRRDSRPSSLRCPDPLALPSEYTLPHALLHTLNISHTDFVLTFFKYIFLIKRTNEFLYLQLVTNSHVHLGSGFINLHCQKNL